MRPADTHPSLLHALEVDPDNARWGVARGASLARAHFINPALRSFFEIDTNSIVVAALSALEKDGEMPSGTVQKTLNELGITSEKTDKTV